MHGWVLLFLTFLLGLIFTDSVTHSFALAAEYHDRSCSPCRVQYIVSGRSKLLAGIARKSGYDVKALEKYNPNAHHILPKGSVISIPCPLGLKATYLQNSAANYVNQWKPFSSSRNLEEKIAILVPSPDSTNSIVTSDIEDSGFIGCGICGREYIPNNGDTIKSVAVYCNTSVARLQQENPNITDENILSYKTINISCTATDYINNCSRCGSGHIIESGETLGLLAISCNIALKDLEHANLGIDWDNVFPGQYINIPCKNPNLTIPLDRCGTCGIEYRATENVNIQEISNNCSISISNLTALNPSLQGPNSPVPTGYRLRLPCGEGNCGPCGSEFTILGNESLMDVAAKCHVGTIALQLENHDVNFVALSNNTSLKIPCNNYQTDKPICSKCSPMISVENDTDVYGIANMCNVSTDLILYANSIRSENELILRGKTVYVPCASVPVQTQRTCTICGASIKLKAFVQIEVLAVLCNTTPTAIKDVNPKGLVLDQPGVGDTLMLPCNSSQTRCGPCGISYIVADESESLQSVAVKCATMADDIQSVNPDTDFSRYLAVDTVLDIPCSLSDLASESAVCTRCLKLLQRENGPGNFLLRVFWSKSLMAFVFSFLVLFL